MDPQATWDALLHAVAAGEQNEARELAENLWDWLRRGGFPPRTLASLSPDHPLQRVVARTVCEHVVRSAVDADREADGPIGQD